MRYLRLVGVLYRNSILTELEYRVNFFANAFMSLFWIAWAIVGAGIFFLHTDSIGGWSWPAVVMVIGLYTLFSGIMEMLLRPNVGAVIEQIRDGTFDFVLTKPVNTQFLASLGKVVVWRFVDVLLGVGLILYGLNQLDVMPTGAQVLMFLVMIAAATLLVYSIWLFMVTLAFWFVKIDNITELFDAFYQAGRFPIGVYRGWVRALLTFVVPIAFITTFPAATLIGLANAGDIAWGIGLAALLLLLTNRFWNFAIRHYSSASS